MVTVTLDEITLNAVKAALDERVVRLELEVGRYQDQIAGWEDGRVWPHDYSESFQRAYVWAIAALLQTSAARDLFAELNEVDHPADATYASAR